MNSGKYNSSEYKCPACGAPLAFNPSLGKLACANCGNEYEKEDAAAFAGMQDGETFNWGNYKRSFMQRERMEHTAVYQCESCGAVIETDENTAATTCPYCENNVVLADRVSGGLKPNAIIPFKIAKKDLGEALKKYYKRKRLLPKNYFDESKLEKAQGVYVPFWLFTANVDGRISMRANTVRSYRRGNYEIHETNHYLLIRGGNMNFNNVPVDASLKMDDDLMDSIEPFDFNELVDFDGQYLSGFVADRFDSDPDNETGRAQKRMVNSAVDTLRNTSGRFIINTVVSSDMRVKNADIKYVFLPVYLFNAEYKGKIYRYAVNGQTGKVVGDLPSSFAQGLKWFFVPGLIVTVIAGAAMLFMM